MFWWFVIAGTLSLAWGLALITNWLGFAAWSAKLPGFRFQRRLSYQRFTGIVPLLLGLGLVLVAVARIR
jgi:hypothetical protein